MYYFCARYMAPVLFYFVQNFYCSGMIFPFSLFLLLVKSSAATSYWYPTAEQSDGAVVAHALSHAACLPVPP